MEPEGSKAHSLQEVAAFANIDLPCCCSSSCQKYLSGSSPWLTSMSWPEVSWLVCLFGVFYPFFIY